MPTCLTTTSRPSPTASTSCARPLVLHVRCTQQQEPTPMIFYKRRRPRNPGPPRVGDTGIEPVTPTVSMSSRGRWLAPDAVGPVGFRALQCLLPWLAMVAFGCGVAPMRPAPICEQCIRKDPCDHDYIQAVASDTTTDHPSIVLEVSWSDEPHADLRSSSAASRSWVARGTRASRPCAAAPSPSSASKARDQSGCVHHHRHYAVPK